MISWHYTVPRIPTTKTWGLYSIFLVHTSNLFPIAQWVHLGLLKACRTRPWPWLERNFRKLYRSFILPYGVQMHEIIMIYLVYSIIATSWDVDTCTRPVRLLMDFFTIGFCACFCSDASLFLNEAVVFFFILCIQGLGIWWWHRTEGYPKIYEL